MFTMTTRSIKEKRHKSFFFFVRFVIEIFIIDISHYIPQPIRFVKLIKIKEILFVPKKIGAGTLTLFDFKMITILWVHLMRFFNGVFENYEGSEFHAALPRKVIKI